MASGDEFSEYTPASTKPSTNQRLIYFLCALVTVSIPIYLYQTIFGLDVKEKIAVYGVVSVCSALIVSFAYHNTAFSLKTKLIRAREDQITIKSVEKEAAASGEKKKKKDLLNKKKEELEKSTSAETMAYSIMYNNTFFLLSTVVLSFYVFNFSSPIYTYILSISLSAALLSITSAQSV